MTEESVLRCPHHVTQVCVSLCVWCSQLRRSCVGLRLLKASIGVSVSCLRIQCLAEWKKWFVVVWMKTENLGEAYQE